MHLVVSHARPKRMDYAGTALPQRAYRFRSREGSEGQLFPAAGANRPRVPDARWTAKASSQWLRRQPVE